MRNDILPFVSVIMPMHNGIETLDRSMASLLRQTFPDWKLFAVDDGSTDGSYDRLIEWSRRDGRIHVLRTAKNRGPGAARNEGLRQATGEMVAYLDCDDEFYPDYLEQVARLGNRADVLVFGYDYLIEGDDPSRAQTWNPVPSRHLFFEQNISTPLGVVHRRELWDRVGGFDESLWCQEDWEYWKRLARTGADILYIPIRSGLYRFRKASRSQAPRITSDQFATYQASRSVGGSLYDTSAFPVGRNAVRKILFAAPYSYLDSSEPASAIAAELLELLARFGFTCQAFSGPGMAGSGATEQTLDALGLPYQVCDSTIGPFLARLTFTRKGEVPLTLVQPRVIQSGDTRAEVVASFLAFFEKYLDTFQPDVLLAHSANPSLDPIIRLAKQRDIPVVVPLLDAPYHNRMAFYNVDYCLVTSEDSRRHYWEELGLACIALPPLSERAHAGPTYAEFFRNVHPQPGPPFIPTLKMGSGVAAR